MSTFVDKPEYNIPETSHHPAADEAMRWLKNYMIENSHDYIKSKLALYAAASDGSELANYCVGTIERLAAGEPVSDRYLLGLAWTIRTLQDENPVS